MKKIIFSLVLLSIVIGCNKNNSANNLEISGKIEGLVKGTLIFKKVQDTALVAIDSVSIDKKSSFVTNLQIDSPEMIYIFIKGVQANEKDNQVGFFAEPGKIKIETTQQNFSNDFKVSGSKNNDLLAEYQKIANQFNNVNLNILEEKFNAYKSKNTQLSNELSAKQDKNIQRKYLYAVNFAVNHKDYEVAPFVALSEINDVNLKFLDTIRKAMTPKVAKSKYGQQLIKFYQERSKNEAAQQKNK